MPVRLRLLLATAVVALVALVAADVVLYAALRSFLFRQIDNGLELSHRSVEASLSGRGGQPTSYAGTAPPPEAGASEPQCEKFHGQPVNTGGLTPGTVIEVRNAKNATVWYCPIRELGSSHVIPPELPSRIAGFATSPGEGDEEMVYFSAPAQRGDGTYRVRASILRGGPDAGGTLIVAVPLSGTDGTLDTLRDVEIVVTAGALVVALVLGWLLVRTSLHPLRDIERTADAITAGQLTERVPGDSARTEVGRVARAFNVMLERIESAFAQRDRTESDLRASEERMRRFIADASHELRTPLAAVSAYAELFDRGAADRPQDLRRVLRGIRVESERMSHLVEDLLLLARLDEGRPLQMEPIDLVAAAGESVAAARAVGPRWPVTLEAEAPVAVDADLLRVRQVIDNLLANVRVHTPPGTTAAVAVASDGEVATVTVSDNGHGMSDAEVARIFERFFRAETSRSRRHGGAGLGLSIVDAIVRAHGGSVQVSSVEGAGTTFVVRLPVSHSSGPDRAPHGSPGAAAVAVHARHGGGPGDPGDSGAAPPD